LRKVENNNPNPTQQRYFNPIIGPYKYVINEIGIITFGLKSTAGINNKTVSITLSCLWMKVESNTSIAAKFSRKDNSIFSLFLYIKKIILKLFI